MSNKNKKKKTVEAPIEEEVVEEVAEEAEDLSAKDEVEAKIRKQIQKKRDKEDNKPSRILNYLSEEHKWENYLFLVVSVITLMLGVLILCDVMSVNSDFPVIGKYPDVFAWILVAFAGLGTLYALWPFYKPALPEFKKIHWLTGKKFVADVIRVFVFLILFTGLFLLYDAFITQIITRIIK